MCTLLLKSAKDHIDAVDYISSYLKGTSDLELSFKLDISNSFECFAGANYCGNWYRSFDETEPPTTKSRSSWIITYVG